MGWDRYLVLGYVLPIEIKFSKDTLTNKQIKLIVPNESGLVWEIDSKIKKKWNDKPPICRQLFQIFHKNETYYGILKPIILVHYNPQYRETKELLMEPVTSYLRDKIGFGDLFLDGDFNINYKKDGTPYYTTTCPLGSWPNYDDIQFTENFHFIINQYINTITSTVIDDILRKNGCEMYEEKIKSILSKNMFEKYLKDIETDNVKISISQKKNPELMFINYLDY